MENFYGNEIQTAADIVNNSIKLFNQLKSSKQIRWKNNNAGIEEVVTNVDVELNRYIDRRITEKYGNDLIVGEEIKIDFAGKNKNRTWLIDPIDGTRSFVNSINGYSLMISFLVDLKPQFAIIHNINTAETVLVKRGHGIFLVSGNEQRQIIPPLETNNNLIWNPFLKSQLKPFLLKKLELSSVYEIESTGLRAISMAKGYGKLFLSLPRSSKIWDTAPAALILSEIGGQYTDLTGEALAFNPETPLNSKGAIATLGLDHHEAIKIIDQYDDIV
jgi:fructose-1,6-bisphosphatase/inositol monophosphatase family enzyme